MKRGLVVLAFAFLFFGLLVNSPTISAENGTGKESGNNSNIVSANDNSNETNGEQICCHIFGYGTGMKKVNSQYELMNKSECAVPEDWVGGGREIVSKKRCEAGYIARIKEALRERNRLRLNASELPENCTRTGSVIKCNIEGGRVMAVFAGSSGNTIIKFKEEGENVSTKVELYHYNGQIYGVFGNESKIIEYFPEHLRERIRERIRARLNNINITLNENGEYEYRAEKEARFLGIFKVREKVRWHIDPETGEILKYKGPWWGFLANDVEEETEE